MPSIPLQRPASCADDYDPASISCEEALRQILAAVAPLTSHQKLPLRDALGRVLAEAIESTIDVPSHTNSAMDGYAIRATDLPAQKPIELDVIGTAWAGKPYKEPVQRGQCVRVMTGAVMPEMTDTVIMQEHVERQETRIRIGTEHQPGQNVRTAGEDIAMGQSVLNPGQRLNPSQLGLIASLGIGEITVYRRPRVAFFSTGDELRSIGEALELGQIFDSNRYTLYGMLTRLGGEPIDMGVVRDTRKDVEQAFATAAAHADVVISSGGVSVGEADYVTEILKKRGDIRFWKVAMKPGRPLTFGRLGQSLFFGLPGNPVSVMVTFYQFVQPALRRLMGETDITTVTVRARCATKLKKRPGRTEYQRGIVQRNADGELVVNTTGSQGSGILRSMSEANCLLILPMDRGRIEAGEWVDVQPFFGLV